LPILNKKSAANAKKSPPDPREGKITRDRIDVWAMSETIFWASFWGFLIDFCGVKKGSEGGSGSGQIEMGDPTTEVISAQH